jgi:hypothetical protein
MIKFVNSRRRSHERTHLEVYYNLPTISLPDSMQQCYLGYSMYLDDLRFPKTTKNWIVVRSYQEAIDMILDYGMPAYLSFDHDLGDNVKSGFDLAKWIVESSLDNIITIPDHFEFNVHSANPVGAENIDGLLTQYLETLKA